MSSIESRTEGLFGLVMSKGVDRPSEKPYAAGMKTTRPDRTTAAAGPDLRRINAALYVYYGR